MAKRRHSRRPCGCIFEREQAAMSKKFITFTLCALICISGSACSGGSDRQEPQKPSATEADLQQEESSQEALLPADASDEELLEAIKEDIHVVSDSDYEATVAELMAHTNQYSGKLYQLEGFYVKNSQNTYLAKEAGQNDVDSCLLLKYLPEDIADNAPVRITGIVNEDTADGKTVAALEVVVAENLE